MAAIGHGVNAWPCYARIALRTILTLCCRCRRQAESLPRFAATLKWSTSELFEDQIFEFTPPTDAKKIPLTPLSEMAKLEQQE